MKGDGRRMKKITVAVGCYSAHAGDGWDGVKRAGEGESDIRLPQELVPKRLVDEAERDYGEDGRRRLRWGKWRITVEFSPYEYKPPALGYSELASEEEMLDRVQVKNLQRIKASRERRRVRPAGSLATP